MSRRRNLLLTLLAILPAFLLAGCPEASRFIPALNTVWVQLVNDTSFPVDPSIRFDDDSNWLASLAPAESLDTGLLQSGESMEFDFDCDELGLILSDGAEQTAFFFLSYVADDTRTLKRGDEYDCGDVIEFRFVGDTEDFGVVVSVNGRVVD
jgi:hypothetical protein